MNIEQAKSQLKGYLLEIALSHLVKKSGFHYINKENRQDIILSKGNLCIRGRGGLHQCDALGELEYNIPFSVSHRLFLEAKFKRDKVDISVVRNGIGVVGDVNQNMVTVDMEDSELCMKKYHYLYAIFSTSGFTKDAIKMALAYDIFLVDLGGDIYLGLREAITEAVDRLYYEGINIPTKLIREYKEQFREGVFDIKVPVEGPDNPGILDLISKTREFPNLIFGYTGSSTTILLKPENEESFISYIKKSPNHKIEIEWTDMDDLREKWRIKPSNTQFGDYKIDFTLPKILANIIFDNDTFNTREKRAIDIKQRIFNKISLFVVDEMGQQHYVTLNYKYYFS